MPPDTTQVDHLIEQLEQAARQAGVTHDDPMAALIAAISTAIRFLDERSSRSDGISKAAFKNIAQILTEGRLTADAEVRRFKMKLADAKVEVVKNIADQIIDRSDAAWSARIRTVNIRNASILAAAVACTVAAAFVICGELKIEAFGVFGPYDRQEVLAPSSASKTWQLLMRWNDPTKALATCTSETMRIQENRRWCQVPLWIEGPRDHK